MENKEWTGRWIWPEGEIECRAFGRQARALFRRKFRLDRGDGASLKLTISADSRYRIYANGRFVARGPCKGDAWRQYYDELDLSDDLTDGDNVLAVEVVHYPIATGGPGVERAPSAVWRSPRGGLWVQGDVRDREGRLLESIDTGSGWRLMAVDADAILLREEKETLFVGGTEEVRGSLLPAGWRDIAYDDSDWMAASHQIDPIDKLYGGLSPWQLAKRPIPMLRESRRDFVRVMRAAWPEGDFSSVPRKFSLAPGQSGWIELDAGRMSTGYPQLSCEGGDGAEIRLLYAEAYERTDTTGTEARRRIRDDPNGSALRGNEDVFYPSGYGTLESPEVYEPIGRRAYRFVRVAAKAGETPLAFALTHVDAGYPLEALSRVGTSDPLSGRMWDVSLNTLRCCMQDTYEDTPYYEQLQYVMDAKLQALYTYAVSADDRLARKTIHDYHASLSPDGMLQSRYPSVDRQIIPGFALLWIDMVHDHYMHFGDSELVRRYRPTMDAVLDWFDRRARDGLVEDLPQAYWSFVDWVAEWRATAGTPPAKWWGPMTVYNLMYAYALDRAAVLNEATGRGDTSAEYRVRAAAVREAVRRRCWDSREGLFRDGPETEAFSEHAQVWAVLSGVLEGAEAAETMERALSGKGVARCSFAMSHFLYRALAKCGLYDRTERLWQPWKDQLALGLTAWVEDPVNQRSDCHGWSALPLYEYVAETLGVKPMEPGFRAILIEPRLAGLTYASGEAITPRGTVRVDWKREGGTFRISVVGPAGTPVVVRLPDGMEHRAEVGTLAATWTCSLD